MKLAAWQISGQKCFEKIEWKKMKFWDNFVCRNYFYKKRRQTTNFGQCRHKYCGRIPNGIFSGLNIFLFIPKNSSVPILQRFFLIIDEKIIPELSKKKIRFLICTKSTRNRERLLLFEKTKNQIIENNSKTWYWKKYLLGIYKFASIRIFSLIF